MSEKKNPQDQEAGGLDDGESTEQITLLSNTLDEVEILQEHAMISVLVKQALEADPHAKNVPLPAVSTKTLKDVVNYMCHHKGNQPPIIPKPLRSTEMKNVCHDPWDAIFIDGIAEDDRQKLYDLMVAANYMDIQSLLHLACAKVASLIKGQPLEKIKEILQPNKSQEKPKEGESA